MRHLGKVEILGHGVCEGLVLMRRRRWGLVGALLWWCFWLLFGRGNLVLVSVPFAVGAAGPLPRAHPAFPPLEALSPCLPCQMGEICPLAGAPRQCRVCR